MAVNLECLADSVNVISHKITKTRKKQLEKNVWMLCVNTRTSEVSASSSGQPGESSQTGLSGSGSAPDETANGLGQRVPGEQQPQTDSAHSIIPVDTLRPIHEVEVNEAEIQRNCEVIQGQSSAGTLLSTQ